MKYGKLENYNVVVNFRYNIKYGKLNASSADIISAAKNADIHDRILTFPDAYDTQVNKFSMIM